MKIISAFKDYYDSISNQYLDKEIKYFRECKYIPYKIRECTQLDVFAVSVRDSRSNYVIKTWEISLEILGFCGNLYPVIHVLAGNQKLIHSQYSEYSFGFFSYDSFLEYVKQTGIPIEEDKWRRQWIVADRYKRKLKDIEVFFKSAHGFEILKKLFFEYQAPCFILRELKRYDTELILNPMLRNYSFSTLKDPFTAHQELFQFVGGVLNQAENEMVQISNEDKIAKHGFNKKSFRKEPTKKRGS